MTREMASMRILVTGATGFLGRHLLPLLDGHDIFALSRHPASSSIGGSSVNWIEADLSRGPDVRTLPAKMDAIIHLAQSSRFREFPGGAGDVFAVNVAAPNALMNWAVTAGVSRAVFASTGTVYEPFAGPLREDVAVSPQGYYGASKLATEALTLAYQFHMAVSQLRVFFLYGPSQSGMMISRLIDTIRSGGTVTLPREGDGIRLSPTFVKDVASVFMQACDESWRGVWNVASPETISFHELANLIGKIAHRPVLIARSEAATPAPIVPDLRKLATKVDLSTFRALEDGLQQTMTAAASA
jgi:nucleoside-diphosphate-sugar epimerase